MEGSNNKNLENVGNNGAQWRKKMLGSVVWNGGANSMMTVNNVYILVPSVFFYIFFLGWGGVEEAAPLPPYPVFKSLEQLCWQIRRFGEKYILMQEGQ